MFTETTTYMNKISQNFDVAEMATKWDLTELEIKLALELPLEGEYRADSYAVAKADNDREFEKDPNSERAELILRECVRLFKPILDAVDDFDKAIEAYEMHPPTYQMQRMCGLTLLENCMNYRQACIAFAKVNDDPEIERKFLYLRLKLAENEAEVLECLADARFLEHFDLVDYRGQCVRRLAKFLGWSPNWMIS